MNIANNMNDIYRRLIYDILQDPDRVDTTRKGELLYEKFNYSFTLTDPCSPFVDIRKASWNYLEQEFQFYANGSNDVEQAALMSKVWLTCSDDGKTINSNYGKLLFHDRNAHGNTQFQHAVKCLINNPASKKAVMTLYGPEHAYMSNDNPCTMFLHLCVTPKEPGVCAINMTAFMRSNDIWFGTVYDVPFFCSVLWSAWYVLQRTFEEDGGIRLELGSYTHHAVSLHAYERNKEQLEAAAHYEPDAYISREMMIEQFEVTLAAVSQFAFTRALPELEWRDGINAAWEYANLSTCLKKQCGAMLVDKHGNILGVGYSGRESGECETCARDEGEVFYSDGCYSVHAEMRAIVHALKNFPNTDWSGATMFTTHGPCDACMKFMDFVGIGTCVYDVPYKTNYAHYPRVSVYEERVRTDIEGKRA